jgi:hypothetical protein
MARPLLYAFLYNTERKFIYGLVRGTIRAASLGDNLGRVRAIR